MSEKFVNLKTYSDVGMAWVKVPTVLLRDLGITEQFANQRGPGKQPVNFMTMNHAFIEADSEFAKVETAAAKAGVVITRDLNVQHSNDISPVRNLGPYEPGFAAKPLEIGDKVVMADGSAAHVHKINNDASLDNGTVMMMVSDRPADRLKASNYAGIVGATLTNLGHTVAQNISARNFTRYMEPVNQPKLVAAMEAKASQTLQNNGPTNRKP